LSPKIIQDWQANSKKDLGQNQNFLKILNHKKLDFQKISLVHDEVFEQINCLDCGNCYKTAHPIFTKTDVNRISDFLRMKVSSFEISYLKADERPDSQSIALSFSKFG